MDLRITIVRACRLKYGRNRRFLDLRMAGG